MQARAATCPSANTNTTSKSSEKHAFLCRKSICTKMGGEMGRPVGKKKRGLKVCCLSCMYGMVTNLQVLSFNSSCLDLQSNCVNLQEHLQVRRSCTNKLFLLSEQGAQWLQGKQKGRDRVLSYKDIERILQKGQTDTHATPTPRPNPQ